MLRTSLLVAATLFAGCEKAGPKASGKLTESETALLEHLPAGASIAFGGNLIKLQKQLLKSPLMKMAKMSMDAAGATGATEWQECLATKPVKELVGTAEMSDGFDLRFALNGLAMADLEACAKESKLEYKTDDDHKFITITVTSTLITSKVGYLLLADGTMYSEQQFNFGSGGPAVTEPKRTAFETHLAEASKHNASSDTALLAIMEKADRTRGIWFAGDASKTPLGDKAGTAYGYLDLEDGLEIDATAQLKDKKLADKAINGLESAREAGGFLGSEVKRVLEQIELKRDGDNLHLRVKVTNKQLQSVVDMAQTMGGMGARRRPSPVELTP